MFVIKSIFLVFEGYMTPLLVPFTQEIPTYDYQ